jgi:hypothetical protein
MRSENSFCIILCGSAEVRFRKNSGCHEVDGCDVSLGVFSSSLSQSREELLEGSEIDRPMQ